MNGVVSRQMVGSSSRFKAEHVVTERDELFIKTALTPELNEKIKRQVSGAKNYQRLLKKVDWLGAEKVVDNGENWLATKWLKDGPIATPEQFYSQQNLQVLDIYAKVAAKLDEIAEANLPETSHKQIILGRHSLEPGKYSQSLQEKFEPYTDRPDFDKALIKAGIDYFENRIGDFESVWQHGDLTPWHIFKDGSSLVLIDCEHVRDAWPRYYDLANFYSQLHVRFGLDKQANKMVETISEIRGRDVTKSKTFWAMVMVRSLRRAIEHDDKLDMVERAFKLVAKIIRGSDVGG